MTSLATRLSTHPLFSSLQMNEVLMCVEFCQPSVVTYCKGDIIVQRNQHFHKIALVLEGVVAIHQDSASGEETIIGWILRNQVFAEVLAFEPAVRYPTTISAYSAVTVCYLLPERIEALEDVRLKSILLLNLIKSMSKKAVNLHKKIELLSIKSIAGKICWLLIEEFHRTNKTAFTLPFNRDQMAAFLQVSRPSLSRELAMLQRKNIIRYEKNHFEILDLNQCVEFMST